MDLGVYFTPELFKFLTELRAHNEREWFERNKVRYESAVRDPFLRLIAALGPPLRKINPPIVVDPSPVGGSMMRIYRDIRFSRDKSPYKTAVAAHFRYVGGKEEATPAYYLHFEPGHSMIGSGMWRPPAEALKGIRDAIVADSKRWERISKDADFRSSCGMAGESLKRPPAGYDPNHPLIDDLKRKDFTTSAALTDRQVYASDLLDTIVTSFRATAPFVEFLSAAVGRR
jgi:uncharacterized protein (TIGR02453 family)